MSRPRLVLTRFVRALRDAERETLAQRFRSRRRRSDAGIAALGCLTDAAEP